MAQDKTEPLGDAREVLATTLLVNLYDAQNAVVRLKPAVDLLQHARDADPTNISTVTVPARAMDLLKGLHQHLSQHDRAEARAEVSELWNIFATAGDTCHPPRGPFESSR
jgi:hypothetical protein